MLTDTRNITKPKKQEMNQKDSMSSHKNLIYDVGMHRGQDTDFYLKNGFNVIAFEANPDNAEFCRKRFAREIGEEKLVIVEGAIVENFSSAVNRQKVKFYRNKDHSFWGSADEDFAYRNEVMGTTNEVIEVNAVNFKQCLEKYGIPHYLKADIVGSEIICLKALLEFEDKPDYISIRSEKVIFRKLEEEFELFDRLGYDKFKAIQQDVTDLQVTFDTPDGSEIKHTFEEGASGLFGEKTPGRWKTKDQILKQYRRIFTLYWLFGDYSFLMQTGRGKKFIAQLERLARRPLPGWYDTHARHSSVDLKSKLIAVISAIFPVLEIL
jgi:FkbM family methyltransferase